MSTEWVVFLVGVTILNFMVLLANIKILTEMFKEFRTQKLK